VCVCVRERELLACFDDFLTGVTVDVCVCACVCMYVCLLECS